MAAHEQCGDLETCELHEVVPGKLLIFKGPVDREYLLPGESACSNITAARCAETLRAAGVTDVVRLSAPRYSAAAFTSRSSNTASTTRSQSASAP